MNVLKYDIQPEGNYYDKYNSKNIIEKILVKNFFRKCRNVLKDIKKDGLNVLEAGCGEGDFTRLIYEIFGQNASIDAFDISEKCIALAKKKCLGVNFYVSSIYEMKKVHTYDLVIASEVLEHMKEPKQALDLLFRVSKDYIFITIPNEPLWRILNMARGKYWSELGNTPGHIQHWNRRTIVKLVHEAGCGGEVQKIVTSFPWIILLVKVRQSGTVTG